MGKTLIYAYKNIKHFLHSRALTQQFIFIMFSGLLKKGIIKAQETTAATLKTLTFITSSHHLKCTKNAYRTLHYKNILNMLTVRKTTVKDI